VKEHEALLRRISFRWERPPEDDGIQAVTLETWPAAGQVHLETRTIWASVLLIFERSAPKLL
jgi:hypothetical protein